MHTATAPLGPIPSDAQQRVEDLVNQLTRQEKFQLLAGVKDHGEGFDGGVTARIDRLGIGPLKLADGPMGIKRRPDKATGFPATIGLAATWNTALAYAVGAALGREGRERGLHILLAPGVNLYRSPLCGRNFEYLGEDPHLTARMAVAFIRGCQDQGVCATVKHFALNFQEYSRHHVSSDVDERTLHEVYLPAFRAAVQEGGVGAVMTAYNLVNTVHCAEHDYLINTVLKGQWGFDGLVMSDWTSTYSTVNSANAGLDLEMPFGIRLSPEQLDQPVKDGQIPQAVIDDKVRRLLRLMARFGWLGEKTKAGESAAIVEDPAHTALAYEAAQQGCVLLKNEKLLPLDAQKLTRIAVIGPSAQATPFSAGGSAKPDPWRHISVLEGLTSLLGADRVSHAPGINSERHKATYDNSQYFTPDGQPGLLAEYFDNPHLSGEPKARLVEPVLNQHWGWNPIGGGAVSRESFSIRWTGLIRPQKSGRHVFYLHIQDAKYRVRVGDQTLLADESGDDFGYRRAFMDLQAGQAYPVLVEYRCVRFFSNTVRLGWEHEDGVLADQAQAVELARQAEAVVICVGFTPELEGEGIDRPFDLPPLQEDLILAAAEANPNAIVVINAGGNVSMTRWIDRVKAVFMTWYAGQEGGRAIADLVTGRGNPSGKLPVTFEARLEDRSSYGCYHDEDGDRRVALTDGVFGGYRHHDRTGVEPLFAFGHGLSYTTFAYENLRLSSTTWRRGQTLTLRFDLVNTGSRAGDEVAQVYISDRESTAPRPAKELKAFARVSLKSGERQTVEIVLDERALEFYDMTTHGWKVEPGVFAVSVAASSTDVRLTGSFNYAE